jgi:predicted small metal-binding protein
MKVFSCADMGGNCSALLSAKTEERLAEAVSIHLRETHGMTEISQEMVGRIKQLFMNQAVSDAADVVDRIFEKYNCSGEPECTRRYIAEAESILTGNDGVRRHELKAA